MNFINWDVNPDIFVIAGREVRWYGLLFALGLLILGPWIEGKIWKREKLQEELMNKLFIYVVLGTVIGARLGHVLFYDPLYYLANPAKIFAIWEGGLASHGGTIGVILAVWIYSKKVAKKSVLFTLDRLAVPVGLVAMMIRLGNLMNSEIFGRFTNLPWGFRFINSFEYRKMVGLPLYGNDGSPLPSIDNVVLSKLPACHPTQIYEALAYFVIFIICMLLYWKKDAAIKYSGLITGYFLALVFSARFFIEMIKIVQENWELKMIDTIGMNMGQLLSIPFILIGIILIVRAYKNPVIQNV